MSHFVAIDCTTSGGGKAKGFILIWANHVNLNIVDTNKHFNDVYIISNYNILDCWITGLYGHYKPVNKPMTCAIIVDLYHSINMDNWILFGDFNMVKFASEKQGGNPIDVKMANMITETITNCNLYDVG